MAKVFTIFFVLFIWLLTSCTKEAKKADFLLKEDPFIVLTKQKVNTIAGSFDSSVGIKKDALLYLMWAGNGLLGTQKTKKGKVIERFTHPVNFASMLKLYYMDKSGIYLYDYKNNDMKLIKGGNYLSFLKVPESISYNTPAHIFLSIEPSKDKMLRVISSYEGIYNQELLSKIKNNIMDIYTNEKIKESSLIELGMATQNIMLLLTAYNFSYYPISFQNSSKRLKRYFKLNRGESLFLAILLGSKKVKKDDKNRGNFFISYITNLIKSAKNHSPNTSFNQSPIKIGDIRKLLWVGNGIIKKDISNKKAILFTHSSLINSLIDLYYVTSKRLYKYNPVTDTLLVKQRGDFRHKLGKMVTKYKAPGAIIVTVKSRVKELKDLIVPSKQTIGYYKKLFQDPNDLYYSSIIQAGGAIENIRLFATDLNLAYQLIEVHISNRKKMRSFLSLDRDNLPVFIIPIGNKRVEKDK